MNFLKKAFFSRKKSDIYLGYLYRIRKDGNNQYKIQWKFNDSSVEWYSIGSNSYYTSLDEAISIINTRLITLRPTEYTYYYPPEYKEVIE